MLKQGQETMKLMPSRGNIEGSPQLIVGIGLHKRLRHHVSISVRDRTTQIPAFYELEKQRPVYCSSSIFHNLGSSTATMFSQHRL